MSLHLMSKSFLLSDNELGSCVAKYSEIARGMVKNWWTLRASNGEVVGSVLLVFEVGGRIEPSGSGLATTRESNRCF